MKQTSLIFVFILLPVFCITVSSFTKAYRCVDDNGQTTYTTQPDPNCVLLPGSVEKKSESTTTSTEFEQVGYPSQTIPSLYE